MKKIKYIIILIILIILFSVCYTLFIEKETDAIKFKKEYEELNNKIAYKDYKYQKLNIDSNNPVIYADYDLLEEVISEKTGVIYLGFPNCPWCRTALPILLEVLNDYKIENLYYMNILDIRDSYEVVDGKIAYSKDENGKSVKGEEGYFKLLDSLDSILEEYIITDADGKEYDTKEKRIYAPTVVFIKNGEIIGAHIDTVESQENGFDKLTKKQKKELYEIYEDYVIQLNDLTCKSNKKC